MVRRWSISCRLTERGGSSIEVHAFDPVGCFGGSPEQVVSFDFSSGGASSPTISAWLNALTEGFETEGKDALEGIRVGTRE